ncbi:MAG: amidohydrolase family protein, partial [Acidobacteriota bacterium]
VEAQEASAEEAETVVVERPSGVEGTDTVLARGQGPYDRLVIRGATLVDGSGAPPRGPVDVVVEGDRITDVRVGSSRSRSGGPGDRAGSGERTREIDARGMWLVPGFVDLHGHLHGERSWTPVAYPWKLWLAHGVTTVRDPGSGSGLEWTLRIRERSRRNEIPAPHVRVYASVGSGWDRGPVDTPAAARDWVRWLAEQGADGIKIRDTYDPAVARAVLEEAGRHGLGVAAHLTQMGVAQLDALDAASAGLTTLEHWYGLPEALFDDRTVQDYPLDYDYADEYDRFREAGRLWLQASEPGSERWTTVRDSLLDLGLVLTPTLTIYEANRDVMRAREAEWHERYTLPELWEFFQPDPERHGSYWFRWRTADEVAWRENFRRWMRFLDGYNDRGGAVCTGSDSGYIYKVYGFGFVRELELLQEAGFHPLEVIRSATQCGARALARPTGEEPDFGVIRPGRRADLVLVPANPVDDFKVLYGTGAVRLNREAGEVRRVGGVRWTIRGGVVFDARRLLEDVERMVGSR